MPTQFLDKRIKFIFGRDKWILYRLDTLQLTQEKEKSSVAQCSAGWFKNNFLECGHALNV